MRTNKKKNNVYIILLITAYVFVYFLKIDKNVFAYQKLNKDAHRTYNELLVEKNNPNFHSGIKCQVSVKSIIHNAIDIAEKSNWQYTSCYYDLCVTVLLKEQKEVSTQFTKVISIFQKKNIHHKSSEDDIAVS
ncbi:MAG: hypothetical protein WC358_04285 [Ignavibacteria bacterium]|jgi:hypothetical protein